MLQSEMLHLIVVEFVFIGDAKEILQIKNILQLPCVYSFHRCSPIGRMESSVMTNNN